MTVLTDDLGVILIAPDYKASQCLLDLQYQQFKAFVDTHPEKTACFSWLQNADEYE